MVLEEEPPQRLHDTKIAVVAKQYFNSQSQKKCFASVCSAIDATVFFKFFFKSKDSEIKLLHLDNNSKDLVTVDNMKENWIIWI